MIKITHILTRSDATLMFSFDPRSPLIPQPFLVQAGGAPPAVLARVLGSLHNAAVWPRIFRLWGAMDRLDRAFVRPRPMSSILQILTEYANRGEEAALEATFAYGTMLATGLVMGAVPIVQLENAHERVVSPASLKRFARAARLRKFTFTPFIEKVKKHVEVATGGKPYNARMLDMLMAIQVAAQEVGVMASRTWEDADRLLTDAFTLARISNNRRHRMDAIVGSSEEFNRIISTFNFHLDDSVPADAIDQIGGVEMLERARRGIEAIADTQAFGIQWRSLTEFAKDYTIHRHLSPTSSVPEGLDVVLPSYVAPPTFTSQRIEKVAGAFAAYLPLDSGHRAAYQRVIQPVADAFNPDNATQLAREFAQAAGGAYVHSAVPTVDLFALALAASKGYEQIEGYGEAGRTRDISLGDGMSFPEGEFKFTRDPRMTLYKILPGVDGEGRAPNPYDVLLYGQHSLEGKGTVVDAFQGVKKALGGELGDMTIVVTPGTLDRPVDHRVVITPPPGAEILEFAQIELSLVALAAPGSLAVGHRQVVDFPAAEAVVRGATALLEALHLGQHNAAYAVAAAIDPLLFGDTMRSIIANARRSSLAYLGSDNFAMRVALTRYLVSAARALTSVAMGRHPTIDALFDAVSQQADMLAQEPSFARKLLKLINT